MVIANMNLLENESSERCLVWQVHRKLSVFVQDFMSFETAAAAVNLVDVFEQSQISNGGFVRREAPLCVSDQEFFRLFKFLNGD
jgi:hypothetical protein